MKNEPLVVRKLWLVVLLMALSTVKFKFSIASVKHIDVLNWDGRGRSDPMIGVKAAQRGELEGQRGVC